MKKSILRLIAAVLMAGLVVGLMTFASSASGETEGAPIAGLSASRHSSDPELLPTRRRQIFA